MAVLLGLNELSRRSWQMSVVAYVILPITLALLVYFGVLGSPTGKTWFGWVKVVSALIGVYGFMMIRFTKWGETKFAAYFPVSILSINIAEFFSKKGVWLQHRAQILLLYAMFSLSFDYQASTWFQILPTYTENGMMTISVLAFVFNLGAFAYMMFVIFRDKKNPLKEELYTGTKYYQNSCQVNGL